MHRVLLISLLLVACGGPRGTTDSGPLRDGGPPTADSGPARVDAGPAEDAGTPAEDAGTPCVSTVPCNSDLQCATLPGHACNRALPSPRCQRLECGEEGSPCGQESQTVLAYGPAADAFCASGSCRHPAPGPWVCRSAPLTQTECSTVCLNWASVLDCPGNPTADCMTLCGFAFDSRYCPAHGGLSDARASCNSVGRTSCSDHESFSF